MSVKKIAAKATVVGALGFAAIGFGAGPANAHPFPPVPIPSPGQIAELPFVPSPGQLAQWPLVPPPGHWDKPSKWFK
jgi:hypothetical protein